MKSLFMLLSLLNGENVNQKVFIPLQTGSYNGLVSTGIGLSLPTGLTLQSTVGWTPNPGNEETVQLNLKASNKFSENLYGGLGLLFSTDSDTFIMLPEKYPVNYYAPTGYHFAPFIGWTQNNLFIEFTTIDYYLEVKARNSNYIQWQDIVSGGFGVKFDI